MIGGRKLKESVMPMAVFGDGMSVSRLKGSVGRRDGPVSKVGGMKGRCITEGTRFEANGRLLQETVSRNRCPTWSGYEWSNRGLTCC